MDTKKGFNLLRPQLTPEDKWDKIYNWVNSTARVIVIAVELVVIICFGVRVVVDRQARDLQEQLETNKLQLDRLADTEKEIRELQDKTATYKLIWDSATSFDPYIQEVYGYNPNLFTSLNVSVTREGIVNVNGVATREDVDDLERKLKNSESFSQVEVLLFQPDGVSLQSLGPFQMQARLAQFKRDPILPMGVVPTVTPVASPSLNDSV
ncbi:hypothetical protein KC717_04095 [Candidatus Dojkabacteria bacterium]|uniref:PilN domain-containing protein n=1 Tax=Candidatus Dojkabacteria bacterium TaxID=2099670 RepID=A0A955L888_9BACT|nr:hypothetical protein [Candidatus Dojkabacteria bacterium]